MQEFKGRDSDYYCSAFECGKLRVENRPNATKDTPLVPGMRMRHMIHRHEPAVPNVPIPIIAKTDDVLVVNKPPGIPVHVGGQFRKNTVHGILQAMQPELLPFSPAHRLDRPVSGVLIFTRHVDAANRVRKAISEGRAEKVYVARVAGRIETKDLIMINAPLGWDIASNKAFVGTEKDITVSACNKRKNFSKDDRIAAAKEADNAAVEAFDKGNNKKCKPAQTEVRLLGISPDGLTSLVECRPLTGRTHQIRAHLAHIGHPIGNDVTYGGPYEGMLSQNTIQSTEQNVSHGHCSDDMQTTVCRDIEHVKTKRLVPDDMNENLCPHCPYFMPKDYCIDFTPLWLHARRYTIEKEVFVADLPEWASLDYAPAKPKR